jgi:hypothetical protein
MDEWNGLDIRYPVAAYSWIANVKSTPLETYICRWPFDSNICKSARRIGMQMLESDH